MARAVAPLAHHPIDEIPLGGIVSVRDRLLELQAKGKAVMRLESGDPSFDIPLHVREALEKALRDGHTHYTAGAGIPRLRQAIYEKLRAVNHIAVSDPNHVLVTNGAMHGLYVTFRALVRPGAGDEIIVPDPTWTETFDNVTLAGGVPVRCKLDEAHGYRYDPAAVAACITPRTRAIVVNTPHNPTGAVVSRQDLAALLALADEHGLYLIADEAYEHVIFDGREHVSAGALGYPRVISVYSFSKSYAMSGLRLGYVTVHDELLLERMTKLLRCTINGVNSATQLAAVAALTGPQDATRSMCAEYQKRRDALWDAVKDARLLHAVKPEGAFYLWARIDDRWPGYQGRRTGWALTEHLIDEAGIGSAPGEVFGAAGAGHIRFAFSCSTDQVVEGAKLLKQLLA
jgi:aspartate aminotransferase